MTGEVERYVSGEALEAFVGVPDGHPAPRVSLCPSAAFLVVALFTVAILYCRRYRVVRHPPFQTDDPVSSTVVFVCLYH
jgi:hypothetical protein